MDFKKSRNLMWICFAAGILFVAFAYGLENKNAMLVLMILGTVTVFAGIVQACIFYTCPHCGYSLMNVRGDIPKHCPNCGKDLGE